MPNTGTDYLGYKTVSVLDPMYSTIYEDTSANVFQLLENQYLLVVDECGGVVDKLKWQDGEHKQIYRKSIKSDILGKIQPKNSEQAFVCDLLMDDTITVKVITGVQGSGKTRLTTSAAYQKVQEGKYDKIIWIRNNIEVKDTNSIGALPGTYLEKMCVWAMPLADCLGGAEALMEEIQLGKIEIEHLGFLRGRDFRNAIIFCSEAEHLTREHVQLLLGRVAEGSVLVLEGDCKQIDKMSFVKDNGISAAIDKLKGNRLFGYVHMKECFRSETAKLADLLDS